MSLMARPTARGTTAVGLAVTMTLGLSACWVRTADDVSGGEVQVQQTAAPPATHDRITAQDIHEDRERFAAVSETMRQDFPALADQEHPGPVVLGLHVCSVLWSDLDHGHDVRARYDELVQGFSDDGYLHDETGQHWVDHSVQQLCPDLAPELSR